MIIFPLLLLFIFCLFSIDVLATETKSEDLAIREYVFLIDTSASMSKGKDVSDQGALYEKLQKTLNEFINGIEDDLRKMGIEIQFYFYTFDKGIPKQADNEVKVFKISSSDTNYKEKIGKYVDSLEFLGHYTHICSSLETVLEKHKATDHPVIIRLYTDGEENEEHHITGKVLYPPWEEFWKKIRSLAEGIEWTDNENVLIITLGIEWPPPPEPPIPHLKIITDPEDPTIYHILVKLKEINFGNLYNTGEQSTELTFSLLSTKIAWSEFIEKYPDLTVNITPQKFRSDIIEFIEDFTPIKLSSIKNGKYNLTFMVNKKEMIKNEKYGTFEGSLSLSVDYKEVKENIDVSIDNYIPVSFSFEEEEPEEYHISIQPEKLDFGDLYDTAEGKATLAFSIATDTGKKVNWGEFKAEYPYLIINAIPQEFIPEIPTPTVVVSALTDGKYNLTFKIKKDEMIKNEKFGEFSGELVFSVDGGEHISITLIPVDFSFSPPPPPPEVEVTLSPTGEGKIPIDFGVIKEEKPYQQEIMLDFNQQAKGKELKVSLDISPDNPSELVIGKNLWINGQEKKSIDVISVTKEIELVLEVTPSELKYGRYYGRINFTGEELQIEGANLETDSANPNQKYYEWTFKTRMPPWMIILIGVICLIVLLLIIYLILTIISGRSIALPSLKSSKAVIPDETYLYIRDYDTGKREQINISGKGEVVIGKDGQYLSDTEERIVLRAIKEQGKNSVRLTVESGKVLLVKAGSTKEEIVVEQNVFNRDIIKFGNYQIRVSGFYLEKDIN